MIASGVLAVDVRRLEDVTPELRALILRFSSTVRPAPIGCAGIARAVFEELARGNSSAPLLTENLVRRIVASEPGLLERRRIAREAARPRPIATRLRELSARDRARLLARMKARTPEGGFAYTLEEVGRLGRFRSRPIPIHTLRRIAGPVLLEARLRAYRARARPEDLAALEGPPGPPEAPRRLVVARGRPRIASRSWTPEAARERLGRP